MRKNLLVVVFISAIALGCAKSTSSIQASYVSPMRYAQYSCDQLLGEETDVSRRLGGVAAQVDKAAENDKALTGVSAILFWPALFALGGNQGMEAEYARLKGDHDAILEAARKKECSTVLEVERKRVEYLAEQARNTAKEQASANTQDAY